MSMKLGQIEIVGEAQLGRRDAFHVAAVLVKSEFTLGSGVSVRFEDDSFTKVVPILSASTTRHAIVDPLLETAVEAGELFWVLLMPDLAHSLHHQFELRISDVPEAEAPLPAEQDDDGEWNCQGCQ